jgi:hypothetical protein
MLDEVRQDAITGRILRQHDLTTVIEAANNFQQDAIIRPLFDFRQFGESPVIVPEHCVAFGSLAPLRIAKEELAVLCVPARLVAVEAFLSADFGPQLIDEMRIDRAGAETRIGLGFLCRRDSSEKRNKKNGGKRESKTHGRACIWGLQNIRREELIVAGCRVYFDLKT